MDFHDLGRLKKTGERQSCKGRDNVCLIRDPFFLNEGPSFPNWGPCFQKRGQITYGLFKVIKPLVKI